MVWWGLYIIYLSSAMRLDFVIIAPILMTSLFIFISIPMMERKILSSRPEYQIYQEQVSMLFPWFRKTPLQETSKESS
jgi:steroid 5-alpha reductase family enzyme